MIDLALPIGILSATAIFFIVLFVAFFVLIFWLAYSIISTAVSEYRKWSWRKSSPAD